MGSILIGVAWKSVVVLAVATATALMARRWSAAARHLIWTAAMLALLALPLLSLSLPAWHVKTDVWAIAPGVTFVSDVLAGAESAPDLVAKGTSGSSLPAPWRPNWGWIAALIWGAGTTFGCVRLMVALAAMWRLKSKSKKFEEDLTALAREIGIQREVEVLETPAGTMPMTFGWDRPAIFLPSDASDWSEERRRAVLLHELAHVKRADFVTQLLARLALSLYWWNPLAWTAWSQFLKMRERAADDLVLDAGTRASDYAGHLLEVARSSRVIATAAVAMAQPSQLEGRLMAILDARVNRKSPGRAAAVVIALAAIGVVAPVAAIHAQDTQALPADVDATIRVATGQKNFEMLDRVAAAFIQAKQYENAQKVLEAALTVRGEVAGEQSATYADGLMKLGNLAQMYRGRNAKGYYEKAVAFGRPAGDGPGAAVPGNHFGPKGACSGGGLSATRNQRGSERAERSRGDGVDGSGSQDTGRSGGGGIVTEPGGVDGFGADSQSCAGDGNVRGFPEGRGERRPRRSHCRLARRRFARTMSRRCRLK